MGVMTFDLVKVVDLNGDGLTDVLNQAFGSWQGYISQGFAPNALYEITTSQGGVYRLRLYSVHTVF